jgi:hypothetical protein
VNSFGSIFLFLAYTMMDVSVVCERQKLQLVPKFFDCAPHNKLFHSSEQWRFCFLASHHVPNHSVERQTRRLFDFFLMDFLSFWKIVHSRGSNGLQVLIST